jgi:hypothetical protein
MPDVEQQPAEQTAEQPAQPTLTDAEKQTCQSLLREMLTVQRSYIDGISDMTDKVFKLNEQIAGFYQKLVVLDGAVIALSLSLIGSVLTYTTGHHIPKQPFLSLVCPAWVLLLISMWACWHNIFRCYEANRKMQKQHASMCTEHHLLYLSVVGKMLAGVSPALQGVSAEVETLQKAKNTVSSEAQTAIQAVLAVVEKPRLLFARLAGLCMIAGIVLLCIFAVKTLLTMTV